MDGEAKAGLITTANIDVTAREVDFVSRFGSNWEALRIVMGIMNVIRKTPGTKLISYVTTVDEHGLVGGASVGEGEEIPFTGFNIEEAEYGDIIVEKYAKSVSIESVAKYGAAIAVQKTDEHFLVELQNKVLTDFYNFAMTGKLVGNMKTWQKALAMAKGAVLEKFASIQRVVTEIVGFANIMDLYEYLGDKEITIQTMFGLQYIQNFLGYSTLFLLPARFIPSKTVIATPAENIDLYYVDPSDSDFARLGLQYRVQGETNLIGFHVEGDYSRATGDAFAIMGMKLWAEFIDGIAVVTVSSAPEKVPEVEDEPESTRRSRVQSRDQMREQSREQSRE